MYAGGMLVTIAVLYNVLFNVFIMWLDLSIYTLPRYLSRREFNATSNLSNITYLRRRVSPTILSTYALYNLLTFERLTAYAARGILYA